MRRKDRRNTTLFSVLRVSEGGMGQRTALTLLGHAGIDAKPDYSPYVGHVGVKVYGNARVVRKAGRILFGS